MLTVRNAVLTAAIWLGVLQSVLPVRDGAAPGASLVSIAQLVGFASVLGSLTVLVYRLGVWRQEMEHTKHDVGAEVKAHRDESAANFDRLERRLEAIDHVLTKSAEERMRAQRRRARIERRIERLEAMHGTEQLQ